MLKRLARRLGYAAFLLVTVSLFLEGVCRYGCIANPPAELRRRARSEGARPVRVLVLGDSFSVEDPTTPGSLTLGNQLRTWFAAHGVGEVNLSVSGYGPQDELDALQLFTGASDFHPDVVMVDYYVGNDLTDALFRAQGGTQPRVGLLAHRGGRVLQRSYFLRWIFDALDQRAVQRAAAEHRRAQLQSFVPLTFAAPSEAVRLAVNPFLVDLARGHPEFVLDNVLVESAEAKQGWAEVERVLGQVDAYARAEHARLFINIFPSTVQVNRSHHAFYRDLGFRVDDERLLASTAPQDLMKAFCARTGALCNDLLPAFKQADKECYVEHDDHWSTPGHTLAAQVIEARFAAEGLLPK